MDGASHYRKSEQLLDMALDQAGEPCALVLAAAQVHATLALAAATVSDWVGKTEESRLTDWAEVTS